MINLFKNKTTTIIAIATLFILRVIWLWLSQHDLYGDEAQYWFWSKQFDFGYYSKPPFVAWIIGLTTSICGDSEFCTRIASPILHLGICFLVYRIARELFTKEIALYSSLTYFTLPAVFFSSGLISTDPVLLFFWSLTLLLFLKAARTKKLFYWIGTGIAAGAGMLSKYSMSLFLLSVILLLLLSNKYRPQLKNPKFWLSACIAFLVWLPNIIWNFQHGMVSFLHTADLAQGTKHHFNFLSFAKFFLAQFAVFGPILFAAYIYYICNIKRLWQTEADRTLILFSLPVLLVILSVAIFSRAHANWAAPAYIAATILVVRQLVRDEKFTLINASIFTHIVLGLILMAYTLLLNYGAIGLSSQTDIFKRVRGNKEVSEQLKHVYQEYPNAVFATDDRLSYAIFSYYTRNHHLKFEKWNPNKLVKDHFDMITDLNKYKDKNVILVTDYYSNKEQIKNYAVTVKELNEIKYHPYDGLDKKFKVFYLEHFKGY